MCERSPMHLRGADVLALKPTPLHDTAILTIAADAKPKLETVVLSSNGALVGQLIRVAGANGDALLLTDPSSSVGALVEPASAASASTAHVSATTGRSVVGIVQGNHTRLLALIDIPGDASIKA